MKRLAVFASGTGSNFLALVEAVKEGRLNASIHLLVCDRPGAPVIEKAKHAGIETFVAAPKTFHSKADYEGSILKVLAEKGIDVLILAGYMRLVGSTLLEAYPSKIINIHPSLLPEFTGLDAIKRAYESGTKKTGVTVHLVDEGMDTGPVLAQETLPILSDETLEELETRMHALEHELFPRAIQAFLEPSL